MSRVAASSTPAASRLGWCIHTPQMRSSVCGASALAQAARRRKSSTSAARSRAGRRPRRVAMRARMPTSVAVIVRSSLMEIARARFERPEERAVVDEPPSDQMHDVAVALDRALHAEEPRAEQLTSLALDEMAPHHHVDVAVLVLERDEDHAP